MPELPEVEVVVRGLAASRLPGQRVQTVWGSGLALRHATASAEALAPLVGQRLQRVERRAKSIFLAFDRHWLVVHLGMTGTLQALDQPAPLPHTHLRIHFGQGLLQFADPRRFGDARLYPRGPGAEEALPTEALGASARGMEPLSEDFTPEAFIAAAQGVRQAIKPWLMTGQAVVGVGNIYASEALFAAGISPLRAAGRVSAQRMADLHGHIRRILADAIEAGGSTLRDFRDAQGAEGRYGGAHRVYDQAGAACPRCMQATLRRIVQAQRSTFYCPRCQR